MHFKDLDLCHYEKLGPMSATAWAVPLRAIGWLEYPHAFDDGKSPDGFRVTLKEVAEICWASNCCVRYFGAHECDICRAQRAQETFIPFSEINAFVVGESCVYVFSMAILHYIEVHSYRPPMTFCRSVVAAREVSPTKFREVLTGLYKGPVLNWAQNGSPPESRLFDCANDA